MPRHIRCPQAARPVRHIVMWERGGGESAATRYAAIETITPCLRGPAWAHSGSSPSRVRRRCEPHRLCLRHGAAHRFSISTAALAAYATHPLHLAARDRLAGLRIAVIRSITPLVRRRKRHERPRFSSIRPSRPRRLRLRHHGALPEEVERLGAGGALLLATPHQKADAEATGRPPRAKAVGVFAGAVMRTRPWPSARRRRVRRRRSVPMCLWRSAEAPPPAFSKAIALRVPICRRSFCPPPMPARK